MLRLRALSNLGSAAGLLGELDCAYRYQGQALTLARQLGQLSQIASLLNNVGATAERLARYDEARQSFQEASALYAKSSDIHGQVTALTNLAEVALRQGHYHRAWQAAREAKPLSASSGQPLLLSFVQRLEGALAWRLGRSKEAKQHFAESLAHAERVGEKRAVAIAEYNLARCKLSLGDHPGAAEVEKALEALAALGLQDVLAWAHAEMALMSPMPARIRHWLEQPIPEQPHPHLQLCRLLAQQRACLSEHPDDVPFGALQEALGNSDVAESPLGYLLLAASCRSRAPEQAADYRARARQILEQQMAGLPPQQRAEIGALVRVWPGLEVLVAEELRELEPTEMNN